MLLLAAVPQLHLARGAAVVNIAPLMATEALPSFAVIDDPQAFWDSAVPGSTLVPADRWDLKAGQRVVGRIQLQGSRSRDDYVVTVPSSYVDEVQVWYRSGDRGWKSQVAGDRVPLSHWPFPGLFPAFALPVGEEPVQLIVTAVNDGPLALPVLIEPDSSYREVQTRQAQLSGLTLGLAMMSVVVCVLSAVSIRRAANWLLAAFALWALVAIGCLNGDFAIWVTPEASVFNDGSKNFSVVLLSALFLPTVAQALDPRTATLPERLAAIAVPVIGLVYACLQWAVLPHAWRATGATVWSVAVVVLCLVLCGLGALRGARYVPLVAGACLCYALAIAMLSLDFDLAAGLDLRSAASACFVFAAVMLLRYVLFARERYGRDVLGRAAVSAHRDPLTALLSFSGFQQAYEAMVLRQKANEGGGAVVLFCLPGVENSAIEHGYELVERALVRLAACLQKGSGFGDAWAIGRLSKTRFAAVSDDAFAPEDLRALATQMLAHCTRLEEPLPVVSEFDIRIAAMPCRGSNGDAKELLCQLEEAAAALEPGKRIVIL